MNGIDGVLLLTMVALGGLALPYVLVARVVADARRRSAEARARRERFAAERARFLAQRASSPTTTEARWRAATAGDEA